MKMRYLLLLFLISALAACHTTPQNIRPSHFRTGRFGTESTNGVFRPPRCRQRLQSDSRPSFQSWWPQNRFLSFNLHSADKTLVPSFVVKDAVGIAAVHLDGPRVAAFAGFLAHDDGTLFRVI